MNNRRSCSATSLNRVALLGTFSRPTGRWTLYMQPRSLEAAAVHANRLSVRSQSWGERELEVLCISAYRPARRYDTRHTENPWSVLTQGSPHTPRQEGGRRGRVGSKGQGARNQLREHQRIRRRWRDEEDQTTEYIQTRHEIYNPLEKLYGTVVALKK